LAHSSTYDAPPVSTEGTIAPIKEAYQPRVETPHDDFDWSIDKRNVSTYKKEERESMTVFMTTLLYKLMTENY
jgi:small subunit ribosomal protein S1